MKNEEVSIFIRHVLYYNHIDIMCGSKKNSREGQMEELACKVLSKANFCLLIFFPILMRLNYNGGGMGILGPPPPLPPFISAWDYIKGK